MDGEGERSLRSAGPFALPCARIAKIETNNTGIQHTHSLAVAGSSGGSMRCSFFLNLATCAHIHSQNLTG